MQGPSCKGRREIWGEINHLCWAALLHLRVWVSHKKLPMWHVSIVTKPCGTQPSYKLGAFGKWEKCLISSFKQGYLTPKGLQQCLSPLPLWTLPPFLYLFLQFLLKCSWSSEWHREMKCEGKLFRKSWELSSLFRELIVCPVFWLAKNSLAGRDDFHDTNCKK